MNQLSLPNYLTVGAILFGSTQVMPQLLQSSYSYTSTISGFALLPGGVALLMMMPMTGTCLQLP